MAKLLSFGKGGCKRRLVSVKSWLAKHVHVEHILFALILVASTVLIILILRGKVHLYGGDIEKFSNRLYLLSAIAQSLAAILSLVVSLTLIATQLAAQTYSPRVVNLRLRDPWLWGAVGLYIIAILWALEAHGKLALQWQKSADIAVLLAGVALLYLIPFTIATLHSLNPEEMARRLVSRSEYEALDDMIRKATQDSQISTIEDALKALTEGARLQVRRGKIGETMELGSRILNAGLFLTKNKSLEGYESVVKKLTQLAIYSRQKGRLLETKDFEGKRDRLADEWK